MKHSKEIGKIYTTMDYGIFKFDKMNRQVNASRVRQLVKSMHLRGFINEPIKVTPSLVVIDGQHRLEAAKITKKPVLYFIDDSPGDLFDKMATSNALKKVWDKHDYIHGLVEKGLPSYITLSKFQQEFPDFRLTEQLMMLNNSSYDVDKIKFSQGGWLLKDLKVATTWAKNLMKLKPYFKDGYNKSLFVRAMIDIFIKHPKNFQFDEFLHKVELRPGSIHLCGDKRAYTLMVEDIYNYKRLNSEKINLRF